MFQLNKKSILIVVGIVIVFFFVAFVVVTKKPHKSDLNPTAVSKVEVIPAQKGVVTDKKSVEQEAKHSPLPWEVNKVKSVKGSPYLVSIQKQSTNLIEVWLKKVKSKLVIECRDKKVSAIFDIGTSFSLVAGRPDEASVQIYRDGKKTDTQYWKTQDKGSIATVPEAVNFLKSLKNIKELKFGFTPFNAKPAVAVFDLTDMEPHLKEIVKSCDLKI